MDEKREDAVFLQKAGQLLTQFWEKIKKIWDSPKRYQLLLVIGAVGIGMIFCSELGEKPTEQKETTADSGETISLCQEDGEYLAATEQRLEEMIEQIDGAGKCSVMITLKQGSQNIYASEQKIVRDQEQGTSCRIIRCGHRSKIPPNKRWSWWRTKTAEVFR